MGKDEEGGKGCMLAAMRAGSQDAACFLYDILGPEGPSDTMSEVMEALSKAAEDEHPRSMYRMAAALCDGVLVEKDLERARELARGAIRIEIPEASALLMRILLSIGTEESLSELASLSEGLASRGDGQAGMYYAKALMRCDGIGYDFDKAEAILKAAMESKVPGSRLLLMRVLWKRGTDESCAEMVRISRPLVSKRNEKALVLVGKAYLYGKGVGRDVDRAVELFKEAEAKNPSLKSELSTLYRRARKVDASM